MPSPLPLLCPAYSPCTFTYAGALATDVGPLQWIEVFRSSTPTFARYASEDDSVPEATRKAAASALEAAFYAALDKLAEKYGNSDPQITLIDGHTVEDLNCIYLCRLREQCLKNEGFGDIFAKVKQKENAAALAILPILLKQLDEVADVRERLQLAVRGVLAGNIFDLGASASADLFDQQGAGASFVKTRDGLLQRPWAVDDMDRFVEQVSQARYKKALLFVDNAGSDVCLGMIPLARELLKLGCKVILAANETPTINDITAKELSALMKEAGGLDAAVLGKSLANGSLSVVSSGSDMPVIDLRELSAECIQAASGVDLVVLEGMGRGIETNLNARFLCDSLKIGMIKHKGNF